MTIEKMDLVSLGQFSSSIVDVELKVLVVGVSIQARLTLLVVEDEYVLLRQQIRQIRQRVLDERLLSVGSLLPNTGFATHESAQLGDVRCIEVFGCLFAAAEVLDCLFAATEAQGAGAGHVDQRAVILFKRCCKASGHQKHRHSLDEGRFRNEHVERGMCVCFV